MTYAERQAQRRALVVSVYALVDPRDGEVRYIGSSKTPRSRARAHGYQSGSIPVVRNWVVGLRALGMRPVLKILREVIGRDDAYVAERAEIVAAARSGCRLLNTRYMPAEVVKETA